MSEETKVKVLLGCVGLWIVCAITAYVFSIGWLGMTCLMTAVAGCGVLNAQSGIDRRNASAQDVSMYGVDWAIKELALDPKMDSLRAEGLRQGIRDYQQ